MPPRFSIPTSSRSSAPSTAIQSIVASPSRAADSAASFIRFASSAPEKPGVRRATASRSTSGASGFPRACTDRMRVRPRTSGRSTSTLRSNLPGLSKASSKTSNRFVAAIVMTPVLPLKPSISTNI